MQSIFNSIFTQIKSIQNYNTFEKSERRASVFSSDGARLVSGAISY